jgi:hypothetical protein
MSNTKLYVISAFALLAVVAYPAVRVLGFTMDIARML